jgi:hypothetical protein
MTPPKCEARKAETACRTLAKNIALTGFADVDRIGKTLAGAPLTLTAATPRTS